MKCDVSTICIGMAASMGAFLLSSGAKGKRYALPNSEIMIHQPSGGTQGQASDIKIQAEWMLHTREKLNRILAENTGKPPAARSRKAGDHPFYPLPPARRLAGVMPCAPSRRECSLMPAVQMAWQAPRQLAMDAWSSAHSGRHPSAGLTQQKASDDRRHYH